MFPTMRRPKVVALCVPQHDPNSILLTNFNSAASDFWKNGKVSVGQMARRVTLSSYRSSLAWVMKLQTKSDLKRITGTM